MAARQDECFGKYDVKHYQSIIRLQALEVESVRRRRVNARGRLTSEVGKTRKERLVRNELDWGELTWIRYRHEAACLVGGRAVWVITFSDKPGRIWF